MSPVLPLLRCILCAALVSCSLATFPQCWVNPKKLVPTKAFNTSERFGQSVDYEDNIAVVGAPGSDTLRSSSGVVYVFEFKNGNWEKIASLTASDHREYQNFGNQVLIQDDRIFVADPGRNNGGGNIGAVYIYEKPPTGWHDMVETSTLTPVHPYTYRFAASMDIFGNKLLVGAPATVNENNVNAGAAFLFELQGNSWTQIATFKTPHTRASTFGSNVAIAENMAVVVADEEVRSANYTAIGATYVFEKSAGTAWVDTYPVARLTESSGQESIAYLGHGLCIDESRSTIFVSQIIWGPTSGSRGIEVYQKPATGWADMTASQVYLGSGTSQAFYQTLRFDEPYLYSGGGPQVEIFTPDTNDEWTLAAPVGTLSNTDFHLQKQFGWNLCAANGHVLVSAPSQVTQDRDTPIVPAEPAVYEFVRPAAGWPAGVNFDTHSFLYMPTTATDYFFGYDIDIDGDIAIVASPYDNVNRTGAGAVYVYRLENYQWKKIAILTQSDGEPYDGFGRSISISGDYIAIGSSGKSYRDETGKIVDFDLGAVYIFKRPTSGWANMHESYKIIHSEGKIDYWEVGNDSEDDYFGLEVELAYPYLAVGRYEENSRPNTGSVFIFNLTDDNAVLEATLNPSFRDNVNNFGTSICIRDSVIAISGGSTRGWMFDRNYVFMYTKAGARWKDATETGILMPSDNGSTGYLPGISFGESLDMTDDGSEIIVGAPGWFDGTIFNTVEYFKGAAYIFEKPQNGWTGLIYEKAKLTVPNQVAYACMGVSVHIEDRYAIVGAPQNYWTTNGSANPGPGKVYFYQKPADGWKYKLPDATIQGDESGSALSDYFGSSVESVSGYVMIGAIADDNQNSVDAGSVYVYTEYPFLNPLHGVVCENEVAIQLTATPPGGVWEGPGFANSSDGIFDPSLAGMGPHTIRYTVDGCSAANTLLINVAEVADPMALIGRDSLYFCGNPTVRLETPQRDKFGYAWSYSEDGGPSTDLAKNTAAIDADEPGYYTVDVTGSCAAASGTVWVGDLYPQGGNDFSVCVGDDPYQLTGNYPLGTWSGPGVSPSGLFDPKKASPGVHTFYYAVTPLPGCEYKDLVEASVSSLPTIAIEPDNVGSFCYKGTTLLTVPAVPHAQYTWFFGTGPDDLVAAESKSPQLLADAFGFYSVAVSEGACSTTATYQLAAPPFRPQVAPAFDSISFCADRPLHLTAEAIPGARYSWFSYVNSSPEIIRESIGSFSEAIQESGTFKLQIESHGCSFESTELVAWKIPGDSIFVPNVFSPNGDQWNDSFEIYAEGVDQYYLRVLNRYGEEIWSGNNGSPPWNAADTSSGVYFWVLSYKSPCSSGKQYKGWVQVLK
ncbi:gliding motility-associated C-terminal domain-containing protein [Fulvivirgaceae bacterium PWU5]|uniref:Gliding motility-associated C-terminal domain-containing protein n=1 Tax=Dawidia cretensis TaxID=2782350 RepID=A0AAP2DW75_9BACT|nr:gliding motility-associated C-terminal domain-containing protein [Dawidia cretensis]MBT1707287.1 gliding motility-associated C-terminal domain-containing protein [Dawidia cretensis]